MQKKTFQSLLYSTIGVAAMALLLIAFNIITGRAKARLDLTSDKAYTVSAGTKAILRKLDTPVKVRFYSSQNPSAETVEIREYARRAEDLLDEYKQIAGDKVIVEKYDPVPDSNAEDSARLDGVEGQQLPNGDRYYLGVSVSVLDEKQTLPFLAPQRERLLEYDLTRAIARAVTTQKPVVGIMTPLPVFGMPSNPMMMQMGQQGQPPWAIVTELQNDFTVKRIAMDAEKIEDDVKLLFVLHPRGISDSAQYAIDQFILRGGKLVALLDPLPMMDSREQNPMLGNVPNQGSSLDKLLPAWGLGFDTSRVVADANFMLQMAGRNGQPSEAPAVLGVTGDGINQDDIVTGQVEDVVLPYAGAFTGTPVEGLKKTVLLESTPKSQLVEGFMAQLSGENTMKEFKPSGTKYSLAIRLSGKFKTAFPDGKPEGPNPDATDTNAATRKLEASLKESKEETSVILVGDADLIWDQVAVQRIGPMIMPRYGNFAFTQNAIEQLTGDNNLISIRSRVSQNRPLKRINQMDEIAREAYRAKLSELEASLAETRERLNELQRAKQGTQRFILSPEQQAEIEKFRKKEAEVDVQLREERKKLRRDIDSLENRLKLENILVMPLVVAGFGIALALFKRKRTSAK